MDDFDKLVADVEQLDATLADTRPFFEERGWHYLLAAKRIAVAVMQAQRPQGTPAEDWQRRVDRVADRVTADLLMFGGLALGVSDPGVASESVLPPVAERGGVQAVSFDDIREWIRAGQRGEAGGKRITAADAKVIAEKGIDAVASTVMKAYFSREPKPNYGRLRAAIQRYLLGSQAEAGPVLEAIAAAWVEHFGPVLQRDLGEWVEEVVRKF